jgi:ATP-dependent protease ClpP protease subunit
MDAGKLDAVRRFIAEVRPLALGAAPAARDWYRVKAAAGGTVEVYIYDLIGDWGVSADAFAREVADLRADQIDVRLNSQGGDAWDGVAIYNALRVHPARCEVYVDGVAASAASVIAMAGERVVMRRGSRMMVHDASSMCWGNGAAMREMAEILDGISDDMADVYAAKAGGTAEQWRERMRGEGKNDGTWYSALEAVAIGLADATDYDTEDGDGEEDGVVPGEPNEDPLAAWAGILPAAAVDKQTPGAPAPEDEINYAEIGQSVLAALKGEVA